ncbi:MAG: helix-turn-helix domain-containing protein [Clostridia bacterium]|nr:helix-turn-helix domain-containing protein [Clostridia bacterium]
MYSIFVAAPDALLLNDLAAAIRETGGPYDICGSAAGTEAALAGILSTGADILVTDAAMPPADDLDLTEAAQSLRSRLQVVRCRHTDAQPSFELVTPGGFVPSATLAEALLSASAETERLSLLPPVEQTLEENVRMRTVRHILQGERTLTQIMEEADLIGLDLRAGRYSVIALHLQFPENTAVPDLMVGLRAVNAAHPEALPCYNGRELLTVLVISSDRHGAEENARQVLSEYLDALRAMGIQATAVIGSSVPSLQAVPAACTAASAILSQAHLAHPGEIIDTSAAMKANTASGSWSVTFSGQFAQSLRQVALEDLPSFFRSFLHRLDRIQLDSVLYRFYLLMDILHTAVQAAAASNPKSDPAAVTDGFGSVSDVFLAASTRESFEDSALEILARAVKARDSGKARSAATDMMERAAQFIQENYGDSEMSLQLAARHVGFSAAHFSTVFSQKMGCTFIDYLTSLRISKAKELLAGSDRKLAHIAMEIGYNDPNYFSHVFKKREGISPKEYRRQQQQQARGVS